MSKVIQVIVHQGNQKKIIQGSTGENLLEVLRKYHIFLESPCNGKGTCGKCKILCTNGIPNVTSVDKMHLSKEELEKGYRLGCRIIIQNPLEVIIPNSNTEMNILYDHHQLNTTYKPEVTKKYIELGHPSHEDQRSDVQRVKDHVSNSELLIPMKILKNISSIMRRADYKVSITCYKNQMIHLEEGIQSTDCYGLAVDIGTTTVVMYLMDLNTGTTLDVLSRINDQKPYGADVISRIQYTVEQEDGLSILHNCIIEQLNNMIEELCTKNEIESKHLYHMTVAANTTMIHLLLGLSPEYISKSPYIPVTTDEMDIRGEEIGLKINGFVTILPGLASYVGGDITAGILAAGINKSEKYCLFLDLGTNGEMALGNKEEIITCATAAGPAFEGATIKWGIGGVKGAISRIDLSSEKLYETIGEAPPCGICGSGVLDMVAELRISGLMDETGRILEEEESHGSKRLKERIVKIENMKGFRIAKNIEGKDIIFTQKDIREVQMAKAAIRAGIEILFKEKEIKGLEDIEKVYIAGGFGNYMRVKSAIAIGLIPKELEHKVESVGNSAGTGAKLCMVSEDYRIELKKIIKKSTYMELSTRADFQEYFMDGMYL